MKKTLRIEGLDCANCANTLEKELQKLDCVKNLQVNFVKSVITFESEDTKDATEKIIHLSKMVEPDAKIFDDKALLKKTFDFKILWQFLLIVIGATMGLCAHFIEMPTWLFWLLYIGGVLIIGYKIYIKAIVLLFKGTINENMLITLAVIGVTIMGEYMEGVMVVTLYSIGKILEGLAVNKSRRSIAELTNLKADYATIIIDGKEKQVNPKTVAVGSMILCKPGERIPIDGQVISGRANLDTQSLTGESLPQNAVKGSNVLSGSMVLDGVLEIKTTSEYPNSTISRIMNLIENASEKKSKTETFIAKFSKWYTLMILGLAIIVWGIAWAVTGDFNSSLYLGLVFLVVGCPCAFAISVPLAYFSGIGNASSKGILIKGSNYLDNLTKINIIAFDKTGTITTGKFYIEKVEILDKKYSKEQIIHIASTGEQYSLHPLAKAIVAEDKQKLEKPQNFKEEAGKGVSFTYKKENFFVGRKSKNLDSTAVELFKGDKKLATIFMADAIKESSYHICENLRKMGIKVVILSGDNKQTVQKVARKIGVNEYYYKLLPEDKYQWIEKVKSKTNVVGYVGDGINDAPSLMVSDVGISMGINASSASIEASDVVLVDDNPQKVVTAIKISKHTRKIVLENIVFAVVMKVLFLVLSEVGVTGLFAAVIADVGVTLLAILNSMRALRYTPKEDRHAHQHNHADDEEEHQHEHQACKI